MTNKLLRKVQSKRFAERKCVDVYGYDPLLSKEEIESFEVKALDDMLQITNHILLPEGRTLPPAGRPIADRMDCVIVAVAHDAFKNKSFLSTGSFFRKKVLNNAPVLIDVRGMFDGEEAKRKELYYRKI